MIVSNALRMLVPAGAERVVLTASRAAAQTASKRFA